ncbi:MFS transporter [Streptomyces sp. NPDC002790]|uniref:MFS transporter n=1 Tax=Streptomyces sp. NPDC002790 TaxID=3154431 RepID=UPI00331B474F
MGLVRVGAALTAAQTAVYLTVNAVATVLLPVQIARLVGEAHKESWLGIVSSVGAAVSMLASPVIGMLSDRTRHRLGRRAPWLLAGGAGAVVAFAAVGFAPGPTSLLLAFALAQITVVLVTTPLSTVMAERVPRSRRGTVGALPALATTLAAACAGWLGAAFVDTPAVGTTFLGAVVLVGTVVFVLVAPERSSRDDDRAQAPRGTPAPMWRTMFVAFRDHNFRWACAGRVLVVMAYAVLQTRLLYFVQSRFDLDLHAATASVATVNAVAGLLTVIGLVTAAPLSDRFGRRPFVYFGGSVVGLGMLLVTRITSETQFLLAWGLVSLAFGAFMGVDAALTADVLPDAEGVGKDLGLINLAQTVPQTLAPALGSAVLTVTGGSYTLLLLLGAVCAVASVFTTARLRGVR